MASKNLTLAIILSLFYITNVYGGKPEESSDNKNGGNLDKTQTTSSGLRNSVNSHTETIRIGVEFDYTYEEHIPPTTSNDTTKKVPLFTYYSYLINGSNKQNLVNALSVTQIIFNRNLLKFDEQTKLPDHKSWDYLRVFACKYDKPVMFRIKISDNGQNYHYYYALRPSIGTYENVAITSLDEQPEKDKNGLIRHPPPQTTKSRDYSTKIAQVWLDMFGEICEEYKGSETPLFKPFLDISILAPGPQPSKNGNGGKKKGKSKK